MFLRIKGLGYAKYVCVSGGKKCWFFGKFCVRTKWMTPYQKSIKSSWGLNGYKLSPVKSCLHFEFILKCYLVHNVNNVDIYFTLNKNHNSLLAYQAT